MRRFSVLTAVTLPAGDDGTNKEATSTGKLNQENEHIYNLWCSGRVCCEGMLIQLKVCVCVCVRVRVSVCVRACVRACVRVRLCVRVLCQNGKMVGC